MTRTILLLAVLAAAVMPPAAAVRLPSFVGVDICETYDHETCLAHAGQCTPCVAFGKYDTCFESSIAMRLPTRLFTCDFPPPPPPPAPSPAPDVDCGSLADEGTCSEAHCVWCVSAAVPSACYTEEEAKRLPAAVFQCKLPSLADS